MLKLNFYSHATLECRDIKATRKFFEEFLGFETVQLADVSFWARMGGNQVIVVVQGRKSAGGKMPFGPPEWPEAANLTQDPTGLKGWTFEDFEKAITQGISKTTGNPLRDPMSLILPYAQRMTPTERPARWTFFLGLAPLPKNR